MKSGRGVSWREFQSVRADLDAFLGHDHALEPGDTLGSFVGTARGKAVDIVTGDLGLLFLSLSALERLRAAGIQLKVGEARLRKHPKGWPQLVEIDLPRVGSFDDSAYRSPSAACPTCGRRQGFLEQFILAPQSIASAPDLFRPMRHAPIILVSDRFVHVAADLALSGVAFSEVAIANGMSNER